MTYVKVNNPIAKSFDGFVNELFNELPLQFGKTIREFQAPPVNITEKENAYELALVAPGMEKTDFTLSVEGNLLTISGEKKAAATTENEKVVRREFTAKAFKRSFTLDDKIDSTTIQARYENGILFVSLPKKEGAPISTAITVQ